MLSRQLCLIFSFLHILKSQHQQIYFDDFGNGAGWVVPTPSVGVAIYSQCPRTRYCLRLTGIAATAQRHSISTNGFWDIYLKFDINTWNYTKDDYCEIYYSTNYGSSWTMMNRYSNADDGNDMEAYPGTDAANDYGFEIRFINNVATAHKDCYVDSFGVFGIPITPSPTG